MASVPTTVRSLYAPSTPAQSATRQMSQLGGAALIGLFIVYGVGFSHIMPVHNAAHDVRHVAAAYVLVQKSRHGKPTTSSRGQSLELFSH